MVPTFSYRLQTFQKDTVVLVTSRILFCPRENLFEIVRLLRDKGQGFAEISQMLVGQKVKVNYPGWYRYFRVTKIMEDSSLESFEGEFEGTPGKLVDYFE